ncbi:hypothetical protein HK097_010183 [Rhizophlyctis rosea]|uniref:Uncharacterized protein n=1 Tax=Rhizophlyctis rosea TaxID=64517 RepID=A0AAD5S9H5_9FUNG|nr:hypothetical protein HK097_010183 [Rhizophlyctis rosea]
MPYIHKGVQAMQCAGDIFLKAAYRLGKEHATAAAGGVSGNPTTPTGNAGNKDLNKIKDDLRGVLENYCDEVLTATFASGVKRGVADVMRVLGEEGYIGVDERVVAKILKRRYDDAHDQMNSVKSDTAASKIGLCRYSFHCPRIGKGCIFIHPGENGFQATKTQPKCGGCESKVGVELFGGFAWACPTCR